MTDLALIISAALLGLAGTPHCALMCSAACTAAVGRGGPQALTGFHMARVAAYATAGALVAASTGALAELSAWSPALRPLWTLLHAAALALGLWLLWHGQQPAWMSTGVPALLRARTFTTTASTTASATVATTAGPVLAVATAWQPVQWLRPTVRATAVGGLWVAWPCGLLQSALLVAALTQSAYSGAAAMAAFGTASALGLLAAPWLWRQLAHSSWAAAAVSSWGTRAAGAVLAGASGWALSHGLWQRVAVFCGLQ